MSTPALARATEANFDSHQDVALAIHDVPKVPLSTMPEWVQEQWAINTKRAVTATLYDDADPAWPLSALGPLLLPTNLRDWSLAMREAYSAAAEEHGFTAGNQAAQRVFMIESAAKLRAAILGEPS